VRHFMTSLGIKSEEGRLIFGRVARLVRTVGKVEGQPGPTKRQKLRLAPGGGGEGSGGGPPGDVGEGSDGGRPL
jgi:hypothetical protein